jgi:very-short-patch-repair endonuclease
LARAGEWFAQNTQARVCILVPPALALGKELDSVSYLAIDLPQPAVLTARATNRPPDVWIWPFHGRPHPCSKGEQLLAEGINSDAALRSLFSFNQPVRTVRNQVYIVDLLWDAGRLVVEVDGYHWHSSRDAFRNDRHRDFELALSGYAVLRLAHDEVLEDVPRALSKIHDMVSYLQTHQKN